MKKPSEEEKKERETEKKVREEKKKAKKEKKEKKRQRDEHQEDSHEKKKQAKKDALDENHDAPIHLSTREHGRSLSLHQRFSAMIQDRSVALILSNMLSMPLLLVLFVSVVPMLGLDLSSDVFLLDEESAKYCLELLVQRMQHFKDITAGDKTRRIGKDSQIAAPTLLSKQVLPLWASSASSTDTSSSMATPSKTTMTLAMNYESWSIPLTRTTTSSQNDSEESDMALPNIHSLRVMDFLTLFNDYLKPIFEAQTKTMDDTDNVTKSKSLINKINLLPDEILIVILSYSNYKRVCRVATVCKSFAHVITKNMALWQILYHRSFPRCLFAEEILAKEQTEHALLREQDRLRRFIKKSLQDESLGLQRKKDQGFDINAVEEELEKIIVKKVCLFCNDYGNSVATSQTKLCLHRQGYFHNYLSLFKVSLSLVFLSCNDNSNLFFCSGLTR
jgi:hypothetical protein